VAEGGVGGVDEGSEFGRGNLGRGDEEGEDGVGELGEGEVKPVGFPFGGEGRDLGRDVESSVRGESGEDGLGKEERRRRGRKEGPEEERTTGSV
jgi:hypothetical protein